MYFKQFPNVLLSDGTGATSGAVVAVDILRRVGFNTQGVTASQAFVQYNISDWETPESISDTLYGSPEYHWVVMMFNNKHDIFYDWPLSTSKFEKYITKKYDGVTLYLNGYTGATSGISGSILENDTLVKTAGTGITGWGGLVGDYDPILQSIRITGVGDGYEFSVGDIVKSFNATGGVLLENAQGESTVRKVVLDSSQALHHFETSGSTFSGYDDIGGGENTSKLRLDPLSQYDGTGLTSMGSGGVTFGDTLLYGYVYNNTTTYAKINYDYETEENENKRLISLLNPDYLQKVTTEFADLIKR